MARQEQYTELARAKVTPTLKGLIEDAAAAEDVTASEVVRKAVARYVEDGGALTDHQREVVERAVERVAPLIAGEAAREVAKATGSEELLRSVAEAVAAVADRLARVERALGAGA